MNRFTQTLTAGLVAIAVSTTPLKAQTARVDSANASQVIARIQSYAQQHGYERDKERNTFLVDALNAEATEKYMLTVGTLGVFRESYDSRDTTTHNMLRRLGDDSTPILLLTRDAQTSGEIYIDANLDGTLEFAESESANGKVSLNQSTRQSFTNRYHALLEKVQQYWR